MSTLNFNALKSFDGKVSEQDFNRLVEALQSVTLGNGVGYKILRTPAGTTLQTEGTGGGGSNAPCPFTVRTKTVDENLFATVTPGTVNGLVPSNIFDDFEIDDAGTYFVKAALLTDGTAATSVSLVVDTSEPEGQVATPFSLPTYVEVLLAIIHEGKAYRTITCGSISLSGGEQFRTDKSPPAEPGELTYTPWYFWS